MTTSLTAEPVTTSPTNEGAFPGPTTVEETGVRRSVLEDLALKTIYVEGEINLRALGEKLGLEFPVIDDIFQRLRKRKLCEVTGHDGFVHRVTANELGSTRAQELLGTNEYIGKAPVSLSDYVHRVRAQSVRQVNVGAPDVDRAFEALVLTADMRKQLGIAILSGTSIVLYGPSGTGKTAIAERIPDVYQGGVWIPHAIEIDGQIIMVYDPIVHQQIVREVPRGSDNRWVLCERPRVTVGGELTIEMLDLQFNPTSGVYVAPLQMKSNNGVLIVDDFGRQRVPPETLLNRWIVPLDRKIDFLTLRGGRKFEMPFDSLVVFSTNLDAAAVFSARGDATVLNDDAFLRRIPNKIRLDYVNRTQFDEIFRRVCALYGVPYDQPVVDKLTDYLSADLKQALRPCYPRDLVQQVCWEAQYERQQPTLDWDSLTRACQTYFLAA
jgi:predicted ATPase with chaperone activity